MAAFCQQGLIEQHRRPVIKAFLFALESLHHGVRGVDLEDRLRGRCFLSRGFHQAREVAADVVFVRDQTGGTVGEAVRDAYFFHSVGEAGLDLFGEALELVFVFITIGISLAIMVAFGQWWQR